MVSKLQYWELRNSLRQKESILRAICWGTSMSASHLTLSVSLITAQIEIKGIFFSFFLLKEARKREYYKKEFVDRCKIFLACFLSGEKF